MNDQRTPLLQRAPETSPFLPHLLTYYNRSYLSGIPPSSEFTSIMQQSTSEALSLQRTANVFTLFSNKLQDGVFLIGKTIEIMKDANRPDGRRKQVKGGCREFAGSVYYK